MTSAVSPRTGARAERADDATPRRQPRRRAAPGPARRRAGLDPPAAEAAPRGRGRPGPGAPACRGPAPKPPRRRKAAPRRRRAAANAAARGRARRRRRPPPTPRPPAPGRGTGACSPPSRCWCSLPFAVSVWYLYARAADQYHSEVAFSIRSEEAGTSAAAGLLGALTKIGSGSASDTDILFEYIRSQKIVEEIDAQIDLRAIYRRAAGDPVFALGGSPSIEALLREWRRMVEVSYDSGGGIIHVRANAFTPEDARDDRQRDPRRIPARW